MIEKYPIVTAEEFQAQFLLLQARMRDIVKNSPAEKYEFHEHIDYCFTCIAKTLEIEQQLALILKEIYDFKIAAAVLSLNATRRTPRSDPFAIISGRIN